MRTKRQYYSTVNSRVWLEVQLSAIKDNFKRIAKAVEPSRVMVVLKANAYGLGIAPIAKALVSVGAFRIGVAELKEVLPLHQNNISCPIQILGNLLDDELSESVRLGVICPISTLSQAKKLSQEAQIQNKTIRIHVLVDTGMGRLGVPVHQAESLVRKLIKLPNLILEGLYSHFSNANNPEHPKTREQLTLFETLLDQLSDIPIPLIHIANSDGVNNFPKTSFNMVRTGINLYGTFDLLGFRRFSLKPTLTLKSRLIAKRTLPAGHTIGYGCTHTLFHDTAVGTIPAGYADGIPMSASNSGRVLIKGHWCPIIGRVSMDYITVDLSQCPTAKVGDVVTLVGKSGQRVITIEDWARIKQTHPYDIICGLGSRVQRVYI